MYSVQVNKLAEEHLLGRELSESRGYFWTAYCLNSLKLFQTFQIIYCSKSAYAPLKKAER